MFANLTYDLAYTSSSKYLRILSVVFLLFFYYFAAAFACAYNYAY